MAKLKVWDINWTETASLIQGESCFGNILVDKETNIATIFGVTGTSHMYPTEDIKTFKTKESRLKELLNRINDYHKARVKYIAGAWIKEYKE